MQTPDDDTSGKTGNVTATLGEDLSSFSEQELEDRLDALAAEVERTKQALAERVKTRSEAEAFFKK